jgi:hypothetical protein
VAGAELTGTCTNAGLGGPIPATNASGQTTASVVANLNIPNAPGTGSCTFATSSGSPTATVNLVGVDPCTSGISPTPPTCTGSNPSHVTITINAATATSISSNPAGLGCSINPPASAPCNKTVTGGTYNLTATASGTWSGDCSSSGPQPSNKAVLSVPASGATLACTLSVP